MKKTKLPFLFLLGLFLASPLTGQLTLTSDQQLNDLMDPDKQIDLSTGYTKRYGSLRSICETAQKRGQKYITVKFDEFWRQYRDQAGTDRLLSPDSDEYVERIKFISDFAAQYDLGMGLALLSPLELGSAFKNQTGKTGQWVHFKTAYRDPQSGKFSVQLWQQLYWTNNKGRVNIRLKDVKAYAFKEESVPNTMFRAVNREDIKALADVRYLQWEIPIPEDDTDMDTDLWSATGGSRQNINRSRRIEVFSDGSDELEGYDRVLVMLEYDVPEMEYFSEDVEPFLKNLLNKYKEADVNLLHFSNDEPHLQADWVYFGHHDNGQFSMRYYTETLGQRYEELFGVPFEEKDLLYFACGPDINSNSVMATTHTQFVQGGSRDEIQKTFLFRDNYYRMLNDHVVKLMVDAKNYATEIFGVKEWGTSGHSSWAESPTIDMWDIESLERQAFKYEYTPNFIWGNTVQQASAACYDYFKWGEYLEPTRNDFAELGWNDRNYYGAAMATSLGVINRFPYAYPAFWGMPDAVKRRKAAINDAFGGSTRSRSLGMMVERVHRDVDVLVLYPMNLVAVDERFGSWVTQYGYCNFITAEKLLELGSVNEQGELIIKDKKYTTLVALFEPLPNKGLIEMMARLSGKGGKALWFGPPPVINADGEPCLEQWEKLFGVEYLANEPMGRIAPGMRIDFAGGMKDIPSQFVLSHFMVDRIYPVTAGAGTEELAYCDNNVLVGTGKENAYFFGFRPRDDQSASLGYETRTLFEILDHVGAYAPTGTFKGVNDNTEYLSRNTDYLCTRFPNGTTVIVRHYNSHRESWPGGFSRDPEEDAAVLASNPLPSDEITLDNFKVNGHVVSYDGVLSMAFRTDADGDLLAFDGENCSGVVIDGKDFRFTPEPLSKISFMPSKAEGQGLLIQISGEGIVKIPLPKTLNPSTTRLKDAKGKMVKFKIADQSLEIQITPKLSGEILNLTWS